MSDFTLTLLTILQIATGQHHQSFMLREEKKTKLQHQGNHYKKNKIEKFEHLGIRPNGNSGRWKFGEKTWQVGIRANKNLANDNSGK